MAIRRHRRLKDRIGVDWPLTQEARFLHADSHFTIDGKLRLYGEDKTELRHAVFCRDLGICQRCGAFCSERWGEADHILALGRGGDDRLSNQQWLCGRFTERRCHVVKTKRSPMWTPRTVEQAI